MTLQLETGPKYPGKGSKMSGDRHGGVLERGAAAALATRDGSDCMVSRVLSESMATGFDIDLRKRKICKFLINNDTENYELCNVLKSWQAGITKACPSKKCKTNIHIADGQIVESAITGDYFATDNGSCNSINIVYLIFCQKCNMQYVGESKQKLSQRFTQHRYDVSKNTKDTLLVNHFNHVHKLEDMRIKILQNLSGDKNCSKAALLKAENLWIRFLNTAHPFGLNDKIKGFGLATFSFDPFSAKNLPYFSQTSDRKKRGHGNRKAPSRKLNVGIADSLKNFNLSTGGPNEIRRLILYLKAQNKTTLKYSYRLLCLHDSNLDEITKQVLAIFLAQYFGKKQKKTAKIDNYFLTVPFPNKGMEAIGLEGVFNDKRIMKKLKPYGDKIKPVCISFTYEPPISRKLYNYTKVLRGATVENISSTSCDCVNNPAIYSPVGHVITGDLKIVKNVELHSLFQKGTKYRIPVPIDWKEVDKCSKAAIAKYCLYLGNKCKVTVEDLFFIKQRCETLLASKIKHNLHNECAKLQQINHDCYTLSRGAKKELKRLHNLYVITPADKAANNYVFTCKKYYLEVMSKELGISFVNGRCNVLGNATYQVTNKPADQIMQEHVNSAASFSITVGKNNMVLPLLFATPKLHKSPYGWRFIAGARKSSDKPTGKLLYNILTHCKEHFERYCNTIERNTRIRHNWMAKNSISVKHALLAKFLRKKPKSLITADFSTLFPSLPHRTILQSLSGLIDLLFKNAGKKFLSVHYSYAKYVNDDSESEGNCYTMQDIKDLLLSLLENTYIGFAGLHFQQKCGIPMGGSASSLIADLTLSFIEFQFITKALKERKTIPWAMRYIDDILVADYTEFMDLVNEIYPNDLQLKRTNLHNYQADFLDLHLELHNSSCLVSLYDKTKDFNFYVEKFGHAESNMHKKVGLNTFFSQLLRYVRICDDKKDFIKNTCEIYKICLEHGFNKHDLHKVSTKLFRKYRIAFIKYGIYTDAHFANLQLHLFS